jgi:hypothetical protein
MPLVQVVRWALESPQHSKQQQTPQQQLQKQQTV